MNAGANPKPVMWVEGVPKTFCKHVNPQTNQPCGWNSSHSTRYHKMAMREGSAFNLATWSPRHPLVIAKTGTTNSDGRSRGDLGCAQPPGARANHVSIDRDRARDALASIERSTTSDDTIEMVEAMRTILSLN